MSIKHLVLLNVVWGFMTGTLNSAPLQAFARVRVEASSPKESYLVGEPVILNVSLINTGSAPILMRKVWLEKTEPEIQVYLSQNAKDFEPWTLGMFGVANFAPVVETLSPDKPKQYMLRVLCAWNRQSRLAFEKPGRYWVNVRFPFTVRQPPYGNTEIESNTFRIDIQDPQGADAEAWRRIRDDHTFLAFLQTGSAPKDTVLRAAALVKSLPNTAYDSALRWALAQYYHGYTLGHNTLTDHEAELLRSVTGIKLPPPEPPQPFPDDKRLDQNVTYHPRETTHFDVLFAMISEQTGIKLQVHPDLHIRSMRGNRVTHPLRDLMRNVSTYKAQWVRKGDGYMLMPTDEPPPTKD